MVARLDEQNIAHRALTLGDGSLLLVSSYGGRVYGPFASEDAPCQMWVPDAFQDPQEFAMLIGSDQWNVGGERMWLGPEVTYIIEDRNDYWGTFVVPADIDPAPHTFTDGDTVTMNRQGSLIARNTAAGTVKFEATVSVTAADSPFRFVGDADHPLRKLECAGYTVAIDLHRSDSTDAPLETWDLVQLPSGGTVVVPLTGPAEVTDYYAPVGDLLSEHPGAALVPLTGENKFKIGFKAPCVQGRAGYVQKIDDNQYSLLVRHSPVDPSAPYGEEPDFAPGVMGDPIHIYSDDGMLGGFGEIESRGLPTGTDTGRMQAQDRFTSWWFTGDRQTIDQASRMLLGVSLERALG